MKISTEIAKGIPNLADTMSMGMYNVREVATRLGISGRRVRAIALEYFIGRIIGGARIFLEVEIEAIRRHTKRGGHRVDGTEPHAS